MYILVLHVFHASVQLPFPSSTGESGPDRLCSRTPTTSVEPRWKSSNGEMATGTLSATAGKLNIETISQGLPACICWLTLMQLFSLYRYSTYTNSQPNKSVTNSYMPLSTSTPMMSGRAAGYNRSKENMHTATSFRPFHGHTNTQHTQVPGVDKHRGRGVTPHNTTNTGPPNMPNPSSNQMIAPNAARSFSPVNMGPSSAPGKAIEPSKYHVRDNFNSVLCHTNNFDLNCV